MKKIIVFLFVLVFCFSVGIAESKEKELKKEEKPKRKTTLVLSYLNKLLKESGNRKLTADELDEIARLATIDEIIAQIRQDYKQPYSKGPLEQPELEQLRNERLRFENLLWEFKRTNDEIQMQQWYLQSVRMQELEEMRLSIMNMYLFPLWFPEYSSRLDWIDYLWIYLLLKDYPKK